jgi:hypothetical protein
MNTLTSSVAAYIAGLVDGEGTITLSRLHKHANRRLVVTIANTELVLLQFVLTHVGAGKITRKRTTSEKHTPSFCYAISSRQALTLLKQLLPYLQSYKRERAALALEHYEALTPRNGKYTAAALEQRRGFEDAVLAITPAAATLARLKSLRATLGPIMFEPRVIDGLKRSGRR